MKVPSRYFIASALFALILAIAPAEALGLHANPAPTEDAPPSPAAVDDTTLYVTPTGTGGGTSWADATDLQSALAAATAGDEIWVAEGVYTPGTQASDTFLLKSGVAAYGGFDGTETAREQRDAENNRTVLSGDIDGNDDNQFVPGIVFSPDGIQGTNARHVVTIVNGASATVLDGFTVNAGAGAGPQPNGGGVYIEGGLPSLANLFISANTAPLGGGLYTTNASPSLANITVNRNWANRGGGIYLAGGRPTLTDPAHATLTNVTFTFNEATATSQGIDGGGGLYNLNTSPTLSDVTFIGNRAWRGGGIHNHDGSNPTLTDVTFTTNGADSDGGGMYNSVDSSPTLTNVEFDQNRSVFAGGGLANFNSSSPALTNVSFSGNTVNTGIGGGMYNLGSSPKLTDVAFSGNTGAVGGGMYNSGSNPELINVTFSGNTAANAAGGLYNAAGSSPALTDVTFSGNTANIGDGGGMYNQSSSPTLTNVSFSGNTANNGDGGGIYNFDGSSPTLDGVTFEGNSAVSGGGMHNVSSGPTLTNVTFNSNMATGDGGGMVNTSSNPTLTNVTFSGNAATGNGGGLYATSGSPTLTNVTLSGNGAFLGRGGGMYLFQTTALIQNSVIWGNTAGMGSPNAVVPSEQGGPTFRHSLIEGGLPANVADGGSNVFADPFFVRAVDCGADGCGDDPNTAADESANDDYGDLRLQGGSPAVDAGDNAADLDGSGAGTDTISDVANDLAGQPRIVAVTTLPPVVDMGAYERSEITPPVAQPGGPYSVDEGSPLALDGSASSDDGEIVSYGWDCTNDSSIDTTSPAPTGSTCTYADDGSFTLRLVVTDNFDEVDSATTTVSVANVAPLLSAPLNQSTTAGNAKVFNLGSFSDPGAEGSWSVTVDWGDDTLPAAVTAAAPGPLNALHSYAAAGTYNVGVTIDDGDASDEQGFQVVVNPAAPGTPQVSAPAAQSGVPGVAKQFTLGSFADAGSSGPWTVTVDWGDGTPLTQFTVATAGSLPARNHTYAAAGAYDVLVTVNDGTLVGSGGFTVVVSPTEPGGPVRLFLPSVQNGAP